MPHYHIVEATEAVKPVLGKYFKEPERSGLLPFHLVKQYFKGAKVSYGPLAKWKVTLKNRDEDGTGNGYLFIPSSGDRDLVHG